MVTVMIFTGPGFDFAIWCFQRLSPEQNFQAIQSYGHSNAGHLTVSARKTIAPMKRRASDGFAHKGMVSRVR
jgi:hypothetical protein